jgi:hypothetical protein
MILWLSQFEFDANLFLEKGKSRRLYIRYTLKRQFHLSRSEEAQPLHRVHHCRNTLSLSELHQCCQWTNLNVSYALIGNTAVRLLGREQQDADASRAESRRVPNIATRN